MITLFCAKALTYIDKNGKIDFNSFAKELWGPTGNPKSAELYVSRQYYRGYLRYEDETWLLSGMGAAKLARFLNKNKI
jgi:hypothetical protein